MVGYHSTSRSTGRSTDEALDWLLEKSLDRSLDGLLEGPLDELYDRSLTTSSSILTTGERVEWESWTVARRVNLGGWTAVWAIE